MTSTPQAPAKEAQGTSITPPPQPSDKAAASQKATTATFSGPSFTSLVVEVSVVKESNFRAEKKLLLELKTAHQVSAELALTQ